MNNAANHKIVAITPPAAIVDNAAVTTASIDCAGFRHCIIVVMLGALDIAVAAMKVRESDDDSSYADVTGLDFSVSPATLPAATADNNLYAFHVDLRGRKRYLDLSLTGGDGTSGSYFAVFAILSKAEEAPNSASERGFAAELFA